MKLDWLAVCRMDGAATRPISKLWSDRLCALLGKWADPDGRHVWQGAEGRVPGDWDRRQDSCPLTCRAKQKAPFIVFEGLAQNK